MLLLGTWSGAKEIKYFQCIYKDGSEDWFLYAYDKKNFYIFEKKTFKERQRFKIEKEKENILFAPVFQINEKENNLYKHSEFRFDKFKESLHIHYYSSAKSKASDHYLKCQEVKPLK